MKKNNIILIGPSGFLGPAILRKYPKIIAVGRKRPPFYCKNKFIKIKNIYDLKKLDNIKIDYVIFLVGNSNHHILNKSKIIRAFKYNVFPLQKTLEYFSKKKIKKFISFSGALIYDEKKLKLPCKENNKLNPYKNNYILSKFFAEKISEFYQKFVPNINIRLSNIYGPSLLSRPDIIISIFNKIIKKQKIEILSNKPVRDFIYVDDVATAIIKLLYSKFTGNINLGSGKPNSIKKICEIIEKLTNKKILCKNIKVDGPYKYYHDITLLKKHTNWRQKVSLKKGLLLTWKFMKKIRNKRVG